MTVNVETIIESRSLQLYCCHLVNDTSIVRSTRDDRHLLCLAHLLALLSSQSYIIIYWLLQVPLLSVLCLSVCLYVKWLLQEGVVWFWLNLGCLLVLRSSCEKYKNGSTVAIKNLRKAAIFGLFIKLRCSYLQTKAYLSWTVEHFG